MAAMKTFNQHNTEERLQKVIASAGLASRRGAEELILAGKVSVNGKVVTELGVKVSGKDRVEVDGQIINKKKLKYYLFNKPRDVLVTMDDPKERKTIAEYFEPGEGLHPIGRLDRNTAGLILVTNDGELTNRLIHPRYKVAKKYYVRSSGLLTEDKLNILKNGVKLSDGITAPAVIELIGQNKEYTEFYITIREGKNRQIRRMVEAVGSDVLSLMRVKFAFLTLQGLKPGQKRKLTQQEISGLRKITGIEGQKCLKMMKKTQTTRNKNYR